MTIEKLLKKYKVVDEDASNLNYVDCDEAGRYLSCVDCPINSILKQGTNEKCYQVYKRLEKEQKIKEILK